MKKSTGIWTVTLMTFLTCPLDAEPAWMLEGLCGTAYNAVTPLYIHQDGFPDIRFHARYSSRPFERPLYYIIRAARWNGTGAWEAEFIHHKLFLDNRPPEVQRFTMTHGWNILTVNRAWEKREVTLRAGAGIVIPHPETTIRNKPHSEHNGLLKRGYYISGPVVAGGIGKRFTVWSRLFVTVEGKMTLSFARINVSRGNADVVNIALHGLIGAGWAF